jgi:hypothetical protein
MSTAPTLPNFLVMLREVLWRMNEKLVRLEKDTSLAAQQSGELAAELRALAAEAHKLGSEIDFVAGRLSGESKGMSTPQRVDEEREKIRHETERSQQRVDEEREKIGHEAKRAQQRIDEEREKIRHEAERVHHKLVAPDYTLVKPDGKTLVHIKGRTQLTADEALDWCDLIKKDSMK